MVGLYFVSVLIILFVNLDQVPYYFGLIFTDAFEASYFTGDSFLGGVVGGLMVLGIRRGHFPMRPVLVLHLWRMEQQN